MASLLQFTKHSSKYLTHLKHPVLSASTIRYSTAVLSSVNNNKLNEWQSSKNKIPQNFIFGQQSRNYKNFGHQKPPPSEKFVIFYFTLLFCGLTLPMVNFSWFINLWREYFPKADAAVLSTEDKNELNAEDVEAKNEELAEVEKPKKGKVGFRDRKIIEYENRIRQFSTPDKVFRYFATLQVIHPNGESEIYMTPDDFLRSITPGMKQPEGLGLDQFKRFDSKAGDKHFSETVAEELGLEENSIFFKLGSSGLISFSDYIFLLTVLSTSRRHFEIAFQMFDLNGDGNVDSEEFDQVAALLRQTTSVGNRHRDHSATGSTFKGVNSALSTYFFGPNLDHRLTIEKFLEFQKQLQTEILTLEFKRKEQRPDGKISENDFADLLIAYAGYPGTKKSKMMKQVRKAFKESSVGVTLEEYLSFFHFLNNINDVDTALTFYNIASASIDPATLKHVAKTVAHVDLSENVISIVFTIFDENLDGQLSHREFVAVMKNRLMRGLEKPKDTGFIKLIQAATKCAKQTRPVLLDF